MSKTSFHTSPDWEKISSTLLTGQSWRLGLQLFAQARGFKSCASHQPMHQTWMILNLDQNWEVFFHMFEKLWNLNVDPYKIMTSNVSSPSKFWYFRQLTVTELFETFHHWSLAQKNTSLVVFFDWWQHLLFETTLEGSDTWENDVPLRCHAKSSQIQKNDTPPQVPASYDTRGACDFAKAAMSVLCFHFFEAVDLVLVCSLPCYTVICLFSLWTIHTTMYFPRQAFLLL